MSVNLLDIKAVVGLGNPGRQYALTRHNIGFLIVDYLQDVWRGSTFKEKGESAFSKCEAPPVTLIKPLTFMNLSGKVLPAYMQFYKWTPDQLLVIHDDTEIPFLDVRLKQGGGAGGHNGLKSLDSTIGANYWRLRIGVGRPAFGSLSDHVLGAFTGPEQEDIASWLPRIGEKLPSLFKAEKPFDWISSLKNTPFP